MADPTGDIQRPVRPPESFSSDEIRDIVDVVDIGPKYAEHVSSDNIVGLIDRGIAGLQEERKEVADSILNVPLSESFREMQYRFSFTHAIQCPVNSIFDFQLFEQKLTQFTKEHALPSDHPDLQLIRSFLDRYIGMNSLLIDAYAIDIMQRFASVREDPSLFDLAKRKLEPLLPLLRRHVTQFLSENAQQIQETNETVRQQIETQVDMIEKGFEMIKDDPKLTGFYDTVVKPFSRLAALQFEGLHEVPLRDAIQRLTAPYEQ